MSLPGSPPLLSPGSGAPTPVALYRSEPLHTSAASTGTSSPASECKLVDVHGVKVASFSVDGQELICLPQVFDLFLKHLVGGLHTVYTKLKRLDIAPVVCTVEQVRVLRGLGAIQPGVNRCKLISRKDFETLYQDCTSASSRPGRPPKRCSAGGIQESSRLLHPGLLHGGVMNDTSLGSHSSICPSSSLPPSFLPLLSSSLPSSSPPYPPFAIFFFTP
uniref:SKI/SNO/DAC domain-containing protein n=1 Tax=Myripristis murdjan TaxID=586833 RepID=A0A667YTL7_9TELE